MENDKTLHNWIDKTITQKELENFKKRPEYNELKQLWEATEGMEAPDFDKELMLKEILAVPKNQVKQKTKVRQLPKWLPLLAAAALILVLTFLFYPQENLVELSTLNSKEQTNKLPDGSKLTLYENSKLSYSEDNWNKARQLHLNGAAKFQVKKGIPFTVTTSYGQVEVLGTIFTAKTEGKILEVACALGKVKVSNIDNSLSDVIVKDESIIIIDNKSMRVNLKDEIKFREFPLKTILLELEKEFKTFFKVNAENLNEVITVKVQKKNVSTSLIEALGKLNIKCEVI